MVSVLERETPPATIEQNTLPPGVSEKTFAFLKITSQPEAYEQLSRRKRILIESYFSSDVSTRNLGALEMISKTSVKRNIISGLQILWNSLPEDLKQEYPQEEVVKMKDLLSPEFRDKRRQQGRQRMQDPAYKERLNNANRAAWQNEEHRQKMTVIQKRQWEDLKKVEEQRQKMLALWQDPKYRTKQSQESKKRWKNPIYRKTLITSLTERTHTPSSREKMSKAKKADWNDPKRRERLIAGIRQTHNSPSYRAKLRESTTALWTSEEYRNTRIKACLERKMKKHVTIVINGNWLEGIHDRRVRLESDEIWALAVLNKRLGQPIRFSTLSQAIIDADGPLIDNNTLHVLMNKVNSVTQAKITISYIKAFKGGYTEPEYTLHAGKVLLQ